MTLSMERRIEDRVAALAWAGKGEVQAAVDTSRVFTIGAQASDRVMDIPGSGGIQEVILVNPSGVGRAESERAASAYRERWFRFWKRGELPRKLISFFDELNAGRTSEEICGIVSDHALEIVGGYKAMVFLPDAEGCGGRAIGGDSGSLLSQCRFGQTGLVAAHDFRDVAEPWWADIGSFLDDPQIAMIAHVPFGDRGILLIAERRSERVFHVDDWDVLGTLAEQGARALSRARMLEDAYELSLTDPLTGLANRRQMDVVLKHAWSAAERGEGLAIMMLDLDGFKGVNDTHGHPFGDQVLSIAGECLRDEARGADAVIRYGGDEFLVIMPRGTVDGARSLAQRVEKRLKGWVGVSAGVAEYHASYVAVSDLIHAADEDLYRHKAARSLARPRQSVA